jgi:hypothetical protein
MTAPRQTVPSLTVPAFEAGVTRIFALDPADPALAAILPPQPLDAGHLAPLLGLAALREGHADRVAIKDLGDLTLSEFLRIGHDARSDDLAANAAALDGLHGHVLLVHSSAFHGQAVTLAPVRGLTSMGGFRRNNAPPAPLSLPEKERPEVLERPAPQVPWLRIGGLLPFVLLILGLVAILLALS